MTESAHALVAAKAARLRELLRLAEAGRRLPDDLAREPDAEESVDEVPEVNRSYGRWTD